MRFGSSIAASLILLCVSASVHSAPADDVAARACAALASRVDSIPGKAPVLLRSYDDASGAGEPDDAALRTAAFTYDNALALIALVACDKTAQARRVGAALRSAAAHDARLRNAYIAGPVDARPLSNGWWDKQAARWVQDPQQEGTATGNVAWAALALLTLGDATKDALCVEDAIRLAHWITDHATEHTGAGGFSGGIEGFDANPQRLTWRSTEHNIDAQALFAALARAHAGGDWKAPAAAARFFVDAQWQDGHFLVGTQDDGLAPNRDTSALDVQLWAQLLPDALPEWRRAVGYAEREHGVPGGFDFNADRDGAWLEGTAQAALVYRMLGREADAQKLFATIAGQFSTGGMVYATREPRITTGLALAAGNTSANFFYYRRPHLGATAWAALAARKRNPFLPGGS